MTTVFVRMAINLSLSCVPAISLGDAWFSAMGFGDGFSAWHSLLRRRRLLAQIAVHQFLHELDALELQQLRVRLDAPIQRHADLPRPRERTRILQRRLVPDVVPAAQRPAL